MSNINIKKIRRFEKFTAKTLLLIVSILAVLLIGFHFWFRAHAEKVIATLVYTQSNGKLKLSLDKFKYNWLTNKIAMVNAHFTSTDTTAAQRYKVDIPLIDIKTEGFLPMLFDKIFEIDSIHLYNPHINIIRRKSKQKTINFNDISVSYEIGRISDAINEAIHLLKINRLLIDNGGFSIKDDSNPKSTPFTIDKIVIRLDNLTVDSSSKRRERKEKKFLFSDNIAIQTTNQHILLPNNRHIIDFKNFTFNIKNKRIEFDSCTISANRGDSTKTSFNIFFNTLQLTNVNFDTLYHSGTLVADSVFCSQPNIILNIDGNAAVKQKTKLKQQKKVATSEKIDLILQQLLGNIHLKHVIVDDADISITTIKNSKTNTIKTANTNFEMLDFKTDQNTVKPISVSRFNLNLKEYDIVLQNGKYTIKFDSLHLKENGLIVNQFKFKEKKNNETVSSIEIPTFQLSGLSWEDLLYHQKLNAKTISTFQPDINISLIKKQSKSKKNIFAILQRISQAAAVNNLNIQNGKIHFILPDKSTITLFNANINVSGNEITGIQKINELKSAIHVLNFDKIIYKKTNLEVTLKDVYILQNKNQIKAAQLHIQTPFLQTHANAVFLNQFTLNDAKQNISINGIEWKNATIIIQNIKSANNIKHPFPSINLYNINGGKTLFTTKGNDYNFTTVFNQVQTPYISIKRNTPLYFSALNLVGNLLSFKNHQFEIKTDSYQIKHLQNSIVKNSSIFFKHQNDSVSFTAKQIQFTPDVNKIIHSNFTIDDVIINNPNIEAFLSDKNKSKNEAFINKNEVSFNINKIKIIQPSITVNQKNKTDNQLQYFWQEKNDKNPVIINTITGTLGDKISIDNTSFIFENFSVIKNKKQILTLDKNPIKIAFNNIEISKKNQKFYWQLSANLEIKNSIKLDSIHKKNNSLHINASSLQNVQINQENIKDWKAIIMQSPLLKVNPISGYFTNETYQFHWQNLQYTQKDFQISNIQFKPHQSLDSYKIKKSFNEDYTTFSTGKISGKSLDLPRLLNDSTINLETILIDSFQIFSFKDKSQKDINTAEKQFPAQLIKQIKTPINIQNTHFLNAFVRYQETQTATNSLGSIDITSINGSIKNIKNYSYYENDSLHFIATGLVNKILPAQLSMIQPYNKKLFIINTQAGSVHFKDFNNVLLPFAGIIFLNGTLDSLKMFAIADSTIALGNTKMEYSNLAISIKNKNNIEKQSNRNKILSWGVNHFILKKNNKNKTSTLFFERNKTKSFFNYIIKANLNGMATSMGIPGTKKKLKKLQKKSKKTL